MVRRLAKGIELIEDINGRGTEARKGSKVTYNARLYLRKGEEVTFDARSIAAYGDRLETRLIKGIELIDHKIILGKRQAFAGLEKSLYGMRPGGYREVLVAPHLGYGEAGIAGSIPPNALLRVQLWVQAVSQINT
jgi:FKBP-type peptidyl-prolyl cis-trans isomerase (trigger factor)